MNAQLVLNRAMTDLNEIALDLAEVHDLMVATNVAVITLLSKKKDRTIKITKEKYDKWLEEHPSARLVFDIGPADVIIRLEGADEQVA